MTEPLEKLEKKEQQDKANEFQPRGYILFCDIKLGDDVPETAKYYIGVPMTKGRATCPFVFSLDRNKALRFKDRETIGKFLSMYITDLKKTGRRFWNGNIYIQDVDNEIFVIDSFHVDMI